MILTISINEASNEAGSSSIYIVYRYYLYTFFIKKGKKDMFKKLLSMSIICCMLVTMIACGREEEETKEKKITAQALAANTISELENLDSFKTTIKGDINLRLGDTVTDSDIVASFNTTVDMSIKNNVMYSNTELTVADKKLNVESYVDSTGTYFKNNDNWYFIANTVGKTNTVDFSDMSDEINDMSDLNESLDFDKETVTKGGKECYKLGFSLDKNELKSLLDSQAEAGLESNDVFSVDAMLDMLGDFKIELNSYITTDYVPVEVTFSLNNLDFSELISAFGPLLGIPSITFNIKDTNFSISIDSINESNSISVPDDVKANATKVDDYDIFEGQFDDVLESMPGITALMQAVNKSKNITDLRDIYSNLDNDDNDNDDTDMDDYDMGDIDMDDIDMDDIDMDDYQDLMDALSNL